MEWLQQVDAAVHRLDAASRSSSSVWQRRHLKAARAHADEAVRLFEAELAPVYEPRRSRLAPIGSGRL